MQFGQPTGGGGNQPGAPGTVSYGAGQQGSTRVPTAAEIAAAQTPVSTWNPDLTQQGAVANQSNYRYTQGGYAYAR
jgi:hypothetical protein